MKYLICLSALSLGVLCQQSMEKAHSSVDEALRVHHPEKLQQPENVEDDSVEQEEPRSEWTQTNFSPHPYHSSPSHIHGPMHGQHTQPHMDQDNEPHSPNHPHDENMQQQKNNWHRGPRDQFGGPISDTDDQHCKYDSNGQWVCPEGQSRHGRPHLGMFMHFFLFVVIGALACCLVKKCMKKRNQRYCQRRSQTLSNISDPVMIDAEINKRYSQIQRLTEMKNLHRQAEVEPIIYQPVYDRSMEMGQMRQGRMINENSYARNDPSFVQYPEIPVGRPVVGNPYNQHAQHLIYRPNQY